LNGSSALDAVIIAWRDRHAGLIRAYEDFRGRTNAFWRKLFLIFFFLNIVSYQTAIMTAFPERAFGDEWLRYALIQIPVGLLGAIFDCASFVVTVAIIRHAIKTRSKLVYIGHVAMDILIAVLATGWVLIVFSISTALVDFVVDAPPVATAAPPSVARVVDPDAASRKLIAPPVTAAGPVAASSTPGTIGRARFIADRSKGYGRRFSTAITDPFSADNLKNIYFGVVMGGSAMLPSLVHLYAGLASLLVVALGARTRRKKDN